MGKLPSSAEEGKADAVAAAGVVLVKKIILLINTTPSARAKVASQLFSLPRSHPSSAEEGSSLTSIYNTSNSPHVLRIDESSNTSSRSLFIDFSGRTGPDGPDDPDSE